jgi:hypothetical protein
MATEHVRAAIQLEQWLMEGAYNKVRMVLQVGLCSVHVLEHCPSPSASLLHLKCIAFRARLRAGRLVRTNHWLLMAHGSVCVCEAGCICSVAACETCVTPFFPSRLGALQVLAAGSKLPPECSFCVDQLSATVRWVHADQSSVSCN